MYTIEYTIVGKGWRYAYDEPVGANISTTYTETNVIIESDIT